MIRTQQTHKLITLLGETMSLGNGSLTVFNNVEERHVDLLGGHDSMILAGAVGIDEAFRIRPSSVPSQGLIHLVKPLPT